MLRSEHNPILTRADIPNIPPHLVDVTSVFNPGAIRFGEKFLLLLRVQNRGRETFFLTAQSDDGVHFEVSDRLIHFEGIEALNRKVYHLYDARLTRLGDKFYLLFAMDLDDGCYLGLSETQDFERFQFLGIVSEWDSRNGVLFPEKIGEKFVRLERPNAVRVKNSPTTGDTIVLSESSDLLHWEIREEVASGRPHYWDELIGPGPPPIKTRAGWLQIYHGIALHLANIYIYQAGVFLLDLKNPARVLGRSRYNILEPRELYELTGQVPNVVFPSGAIVEEVDAQGFAVEHSRVFVYYGAADTVVGLAVTTIEELIDRALSKR
jgi:predicted GH43/DUF377 family glycosyl hydrolase